MGEPHQPDWDRIAEKFDAFLPQLAPVGEALLDALKPEAGDRVVDLASGTGEPALTLARRQPRATIVGTDAAPGMVRAARNKVAALGLSNVGFEVMAAEQLAFPDESFDRALCRFGVMLFEDPLGGCREIRRVLKPGGAFAFAVWRTPETMTTVNWSARALRGRVPEDLRPPVERITALGRPGAFDALLADAGFSRFAVEPRRFDFRFPSFDDYWAMVEASDILREPFEVLGAGERAGVREEIAGYARDFETGDGLVIPHEYLIAVGVR